MISFPYVGEVDRNRGARAIFVRALLFFGDFRIYCVRGFYRHAGPCGPEEVHFYRHADSNGHEEHGQNEKPPSPFVL